MRNLIAFFQRFRVFLVFVLLQLFALGSYFSLVSYPRTKFLNSSARITGTLLSWEREVLKYIYLDDANKTLQNENKELSSRLPENYIPIDPKTAIIEDTIHELSFERIPATVINSTHSHKNNYFTINAGRLKGVKPKMGVISSKGVVGIVYDVSDHFAVVKSVLTTDINISAYIESSDAFGLIKYLDNDPRRVSLTGISNDIVIKKHSKVFSRGSGGYFPPGEMIGKVEKLIPIEGEPRWEIIVRLEQDMRRLHYVYVIKNLHSLELEKIEAKVEELQ
ncbi:MAG: rod shape-determining protein MreC [Brumimicrobium sp.]|nr:rod shape-determining protein MreC [Brumimicrobium sp.]